MIYAISEKAQGTETDILSWYREQVEGQGNRTDQLRLYETGGFKESEETPRQDHASETLVKPTANTQCILDKLKV